MRDRNILKKLDFPILCLIAVLFTIGMFAIASATKAYAGDYGHIRMQAIAFVLSIVVMVLILNIDYTALKGFSPYLYIILIIPLLLLITIPSLGHSTYGATRWFKIGPVQIQFSEFAKVLFILTFAAHINRIQEKGRENINKIRKLIPLFIHAAIPVSFIMAQPDNGTALVFCVIGASMLFVSGIDKKYIFGAITGLIAALPAFYFFVLPRLPKYVQNRIFVFLDPSRDPMGAGYNVMIAKLSVGSGGIWGQGLFKGIQIQMGALPVKESDFIFSVIGEELGFIWCAIIVICFMLLFIRLLSLARTSREYFGTLIITGVTSMMAFHVLQNIGMNIGIMPVAGIPLPFISYGGSALLTNMIGVGLVLNAGMPRKKQYLNDIEEVSIYKLNLRAIKKYVR